MINKVLFAIFFIALCAYGAFSASFFPLSTADWYHSRWVVLLLGASVFVVIPVWEKSKILTITLVYSLWSTVIVALSEVSYAIYFNAAAYKGIGYESMKAMLFIVSLVVILEKIKDKEFWVQHAWMFSVLASITLIVSHAWNREVEGLTFNKSLSATLCALTFPFILKRFPKPNLIWLLPLIAIVYIQSAISLFAYFACLLVYFTTQKKYFLAFMTASIPMLGLAVYHEDLYNFSGRIPFWINTLSFFDRYPERQLFGFGLGSFSEWSYVIMRDFDMVKIYGQRNFSTAHNDFLQLYFDLGIVGLVLWIATYLSFVYRSRNTPWLLAFFGGLFVASFGNFPHHLTLEALIIAFVIGYVIENQTRKVYVDGKSSI